MLIYSNRVRRRVILAAFYIFVMVVRWLDDAAGQVAFGIAFAAIVIGIGWALTRYCPADPEPE